ncbi:MAG TPA: HIT domain-containing protein [Pseudonocardiaceae bacterium]
MNGCRICDKHRGVGPLVGPEVWSDDLLLVFHRPPGPDGTGVLGYLFVETRRHAPSLTDLTEAEARAVGTAIWRAGRALRAELSAESVFTAVIGTGVAHFHHHVLARHPGTPPEYGWMDSHAWPEAPRGDPEEIAELCSRLRRHFDG